MMMVPFLSLFIWLHFSTFCHELGHFVCAKLVGMSPQLMKVGRGFRIFRKNFFGARLELGILPVGGLTYAYYPDTGWSKFEDLKLKLIIYTMGGCLANSVLLMCLIMMLIYTGFPALRYFIYIEIVTIITNLVPIDVLLYGTKLPSDGKQFFSILTQNYQRYFFARHQKAIARIAGDRTEPKILFKNDIRTLELFVKAETKLAYRRFDEAIALWNQLLNTENATDVERAYLLDILASIVINLGQKQYLAQADRWSQEALKLAGHSKTIQVTRGAILIELGQYEEGKQMLILLTKSGNDPVDVVIGSYYLAKADHRLGNNEQAWIWLKQAEMAGKKVPGLPELFAIIKQELRESLN
ncbi:MAG: site-2 protease family protein [Acidobacteria bacterium]|nr:site-2 protease family protein [Acidobacteriota bacterium]